MENDVQTLGREENSISSCISSKFRQLQLEIFHSIQKNFPLIIVTYIVMLSLFSAGLPIWADTAAGALYPPPGPRHVVYPGAVSLARLYCHYQSDCWTY